MSSRRDGDNGAGNASLAGGSDELELGFDLELELLRDQLAGRPIPPLRVEVARAVGGSSTDADQAFSEQLARIAREVGELLPAPSLVHDDPDDQLAAAGDRHAAAAGQPLRPALRLRWPGGQRIDYGLLPVGPERSPFVEALQAGATDPGADPGALAARLAHIARPAAVEVFVAAACPHCPELVRAANAVALACPRVPVALIDAQRFEARAERYAIRSVPTTVIDGEFTIVGLVSADELAGRITTREGPDYGADLLRSLAEAGRIADLARRLQSGTAAINHALSGCWRTSTTSLRVGLLLAAEEALEAAPACLDAAVEELLPLLAVRDTALRGDTIDLLGRVAHPATALPLGALLDDDDPDIVEAATEALAAIATRRRGGAA